MDLNIGDDFFIQIFGAPNSGKSHNIRYLISKLSREGKFDYVILISHTAHLTDDFDYVPKEYQFSSYSDELLLKILKLQSKAIRDTKIKKKPRCLIILDDILGKTRFNSDLLVQFTSQYRHFRCNVILTSQYINKIPPQMREGASHVILYKQHTGKSIDAAYDSFGIGYFEKKKHFKAYINKATGNYRFLFLDKTCQSSEINDVFKSYICPATVPKFKLDY